MFTVQGKVSVPTDEEIAALDDVMSPNELLEAALKSSGLEYSKSYLDDGSIRWDIVNSSGNSFWVIALDDFLLVYKHIVTLSEFYLSDDTLLRQLLQWQNDMRNVRFVIDDENDLGMKASRSAEDLDISEARTAVVEMADSIDSMYGAIVNYVA